MQSNIYINIIILLLFSLNSNCTDEADSSINTNQNSSDHVVIDIKELVKNGHKKKWITCMNKLPSEALEREKKRLKKCLGKAERNEDLVEILKNITETLLHAQKENLNITNSRTDNITKISNSQFIKQITLLIGTAVIIIGNQWMSSM